MVNIDSSFRDSNTISASNFLSTLTFVVSNVIEYSVYSLEIPYSWYFFSKSYGNTILLVDDITITVPDGNYTISSLISTLTPVRAGLDSSLATANLTLERELLKSEEDMDTFGPSVIFGIGG